MFKKVHKNVLYRFGHLRITKYETHVSYENNENGKLNVT